MADVTEAFRTLEALAASDRHEVRIAARDIYSSALDYITACAYHGANMELARSGMKSSELLLAERERTRLGLESALQNALTVMHQAGHTRYLPTTGDDIDTFAHALVMKVYEQRHL